MKLKIFLGLAILLSLCVQVQAQDQGVQVICNPGVNAESTKVQYSTASDFSKILGESVYKKVVAGIPDTCQCSVPAIQGTTYFFRCFSVNALDTCITDIMSVKIPVQPISGCSIISAKLIP